MFVLHLILILLVTFDASSGPKNTDRLSAVVYADGSRWVHDYGAGADDAIDRVVGLRLDDAQHDDDLLVAYTHLGLGTVAITDLVEAGVQSDRTADTDGSRRFGTLTTTDEGVYPGWDRFGRLGLLSWVDVDFTTGASDLPNIPPVYQQRYERDRAGNLLRQTDTRPGAAWQTRDRENFYDELHRLIETKMADGLNAPEEAKEWTLDAAGNWRSLTINTTTQTRTHNLANEAEKLTSGSQTHYYDDAGSLGLVTAGPEYELIYDAWNRLVEVRSVGSGSAVLAKYRYNGLHQRTIAEQHTGGSLSSRERFFYSPDWQLLEQRTYNASDVLVATAQQFWGKRAIDDAVMRRIDRDPAENDGFEDTYYYITDHLRSVVAIVDHAGKLVERVRYGPYGEPTHHRPGDVNGDGVVDFFDAQVMIDLGGSGVEIDDENYQADADINRDGIIDFYDVQLVLADVTKDQVTGISDPETVANPIGYAGYVYISDFGAMGHWLARHRIFDPVMGRWITRDPAGYVDGMSLYLYARSNPWAFVDPMGLFGIVTELFAQITSAVAQEARQGIDRAATAVQSKLGIVGGVVAHGVGVVANDVINAAEGVVHLKAAIDNSADSMAAKIAIEKVQNPLAPSETFAQVKTSAVEQAIDYGGRVMSGDAEAIGDGLRAIGYAGVGGPGTSAAVSRLGGQVANNITVRARGFAPNKLESHFAKHKSEWSSMSIKKYDRKAHSLMNAEIGGDILGHTRSNGDILRYNRKTNEFGVMAEDGTIRTFFRPQDGMNYWDRQCLD
ncbi:MAG: hypothetical protein KF757_03915 [Phycisphaeraceae bacterium]|nr:hypothetical protein [Phycisphaeraceae bacterium]MCW5763147.1 hypothetical protein [Phycisphaeraceae bacterium]